VREHLRGEAGSRRLFENAAHYALEYMHAVGGRRVFPGAEALQDLRAFDEPLPEGPVPAEEVLQMLHRVGSPATVAQTGGRYFGFVNGGILPAALSARWLADAWDQNAALSVISPVAARLESVAERWLVALLGLPPTTVAGFVSGTTTATLCGLAAGRDELLRRGGWDLDGKGLFGAPPLRVILGEQAHASVFKALSILGLGRGRVERVAVDDEGSLVAEKLPPLDARCLVILQAGNVSSGAFDPFGSVCAAARRAGAWVHVDGAFGLWAAASASCRGLVAGMEDADSWSADAHKTLNAPYDNGIVFCREGDTLARAMRMSGPYIVSGTDRDGMVYTPDMSRRARGVDLWATLKSLGRAGVEELVDGLCGNASFFADGMRRRGFAVLNKVVFNQVLVSCGSAAATTATLAAVQESGELWCGGTTWKGEPAIRVSFCSFMTTEEDVERAVRAFAAARDRVGGLSRQEPAAG
jgi:glutamate/tyrosine decarboxylase-like PLP-dependent enzyme